MMRQQICLLFGFGLLLLQQNFGLIKSENILAIFPSVYRSHLIFGYPIFAELANRGHKITLISQWSLTKSQKHENITEIKLNGIREHFQMNGLDQRSIAIQKLTDQSNWFSEYNTLIDITSTLAEYTLNYSNVTELIQMDGEKFDLILLDMYFMDAFLGLSYLWKIPTVVISAMSTNKWTNEMVGNYFDSAYNANAFLGYTNTMTLQERLVNLLVSAYERMTYDYMYLPAQETIYERYFEKLINQKDQLPRLQNLIHNNVNLVLVNSHPAIGPVRSLPPNMIEIGGLHLTNPQRLNRNRNITILDKLPEEIDDYIRIAPEGVIYINLGSTGKSSELSLDKILAFNSVFESLLGKMRVIWKWDNVTLINHPKNVIVGAKLPQQLILGHPNVRLFITNGGSLSIMETISAGKPIIGIPIYGDQHSNIAHAVELGFGKLLSLSDLNEQRLNETIMELLSNTMFAENANRVGQLFKLNSIDPLDNAVFHIENIFKINGTQYLRISANDLSWLQRNSYDSLVILIWVILIIISIPYFVIGWILRKANNASNSDANKRKKQIKRKQQ